MGNAEFGPERYGTDSGPPCRKCKQTLYIYLCLLDCHEVQAQCACCHDVTTFRYNVSSYTTARDLRKGHERAVADRVAHERAIAEKVQAQQQQLRREPHRGKFKYHLVVKGSLQQASDAAESRGFHVRRFKSSRTPDWSTLYVYTHRPRDVARWFAEPMPCGIAQPGQLLWYRDVTDLGAL